MPKKYFTFFILIILTLIIFPQIIRAQTATLYFSPSSGTFSQGDSFWLTIMVNTAGQAVNAVAAYFSYPEDKLTALGVDTSGSVMTIWAEKNAGSGKVEIAGGLPTPGFSGIKKIASIGFKAKVSSGSVNLKFSEDSAVLTDAENKNILSLVKSGEGNYSFKVKVVPPSPLPEIITPPAEEEITAPEISEITVGEIARNEVTIFWKTDQETDSTIEYGLTSDYLLTLVDEKLTREHSITISELLPGTLYHFKVKSKNSTGGQTESEDLTFSTLGYSVEITVLNLADNQPLAEAEIFYPGPPPITKKTNQESKVVFENFSPGKQWISIKYKDTSLSYLLDISETAEVQKFKVLFKIPAPKISLFLVISIIILIGLVLSLMIKVIKYFTLKKKIKSIANEKLKEKKETSLR